MTSRGFRAAVFSSIALTIALLYGRVLGFFFTDIDTLPLIATGRVTSWADVVDIVTSPLMRGQMPNALFYRPLASLSWGLDWALFGSNPTGYHATDVALHSVNAMLLFSWLRCLGSDASQCTPASSRRSAEAAIAALLFALHPIAMETVPAIARRPDLLFALFLLLTLRSLEAHRRDPRLRFAALAGLTASLGLASKDSAVAIPFLASVFVVGTAVRLPPAQRWRAVVSAVWPMFGMLGLLVAVRSLVLGGLGGYAGAKAPFFDVALHSGATMLCVTWHSGDLDACRDASPLVMAAAASGWLVAALVLACRASARHDGSGERLIAYATCLLVFLGLYIATRTPATPRTLYSAGLFACAGTAWSLVNGFDALRSGFRGERAQLTAVVAGLVALMGGGFATASALGGAASGRYVDEWGDAARVSRRALIETARVAAEVPTGSTLYLINYPYWVGDSRQDLRERPLLLEHSVKGWLDLVLPERALDVTGITYLVISMRAPRELGSRVSFDPRTARLEIAVARGAYATPSQWNNAYRPPRPEGDPTYYQVQGSNDLVVDLPAGVAAVDSQVRFLIYSGDRVIARKPVAWVVSHDPPDE